MQTKSPTFENVMNTVTAWYYAEVRALADEAIKETAEYTGEARREALIEWVDQTTDQHEFVIYTAQAQAVILASDNDGALFEDTGEHPVSDSVRAAYALRADVWDILEARRAEWSGSSDGSNEGGE